jgi:hypothetical protein
MDRIAHDNASVRTVRATLARVGSVDRPRISLPDDAADAFPVGEVVRVALDGSTRHARVHRGLDDGLELRALYDNARQARQGSALRADESPSGERGGEAPGERQRREHHDPRGPDGEDRLPSWVDDRDLEFGRSVLVDVVDEGFFYGVRAPSESAVYEVPDRPDDGLAAIARDLEES